MGKRKSRRKPLARAPQPKLDHEFDCPFCCSIKSVQISIHRKDQTASLSCRVCNISFETPISPLDEAVDVFAQWIDSCEEVNAPTPSRTSAVGVPSPLLPPRLSDFSASRQNIKRQKPEGGIKGQRQSRKTARRRSQDDDEFDDMSEEEDEAYSVHDDDEEEEEFVDDEDEDGADLRQQTETHQDTEEQTANDDQLQEVEIEPQVDEEEEREQPEQESLDHPSIIGGRLQKKSAWESSEED